MMRSVSWFDPGHVVDSCLRQRVRERVHNHFDPFSILFFDSALYCLWLISKPQPQTQSPNVFFRNFFRLPALFCRHRPGGSNSGCGAIFPTTRCCVSERPARSTGRLGFLVIGRKSRDTPVIHETAILKAKA